MEERREAPKEGNNVKLRCKLLLAISLVTVGLLAAVAAIPVSADDGVHKFSATSVTSDCAGCHRAHTGSGAELLKATNDWDLCTSCHGTGGASITDVVDGLRVGVGPLRGGGFINATMAISYTTAVTSTVTSAHRVLGMPGYASGLTSTVWGIGMMGSASGPGLSGFQLRCSTCHDPHGKSGPAGQPTYRLLRSDFSVTGPPGATTPDGASGVYVTDTTTHTYTISDTVSAKYYHQIYPSGSDTGSNNNLMLTMNGWCSSCHTRLYTSDAIDDPATTPSGDDTYVYRHDTTGNKTDYNFGTTKHIPSGTPGCLTCHVVHGSNAATEGSSATVAWPGQAEGGGQYQDSALLRLSNRGVCEACHNY
jgi:predicted CXXCH cytochrome family protein